MQSEWVICNINDNEDLNKLAYAVQETGRKASVVSLEYVANLEKDNERKCVVTKGSIWSNRSLLKSRPNWIGNFHSKEKFLCSNYYPVWLKKITQQNCIMLPFSRIKTEKDKIYKNLGIDDTIFIRPDSGEKEFNGELVVYERFNNWHEYVSANLTNLDTEREEDILCIIASPVLIEKEFRLIIADGKVVTGSTYRIQKHLISESIEDHPEEGLIKFVESLIRDRSPRLPPYYCMDIAKTKEGFSILEVGCFCCCGLYACDLRKIAEKISESAEKFYKETI